MRFVFFVCALALAAGGCSHEFDYIRPSMVQAAPPPPPDAPGQSHMPYKGKPKYLVEARPMHATTSGPTMAGDECARASKICDDRLRAALASMDGQILAMSTPPTELQLKALRLDAAQLAGLLAPYPDMAAERDELAVAVENLPTLTEIDQGTSRRRMTELTDLIRVQLAAAQ